MPSPLFNLSLFPPGSRILVAVSGGLDSVVLLHALHAHKLKTGVAHVNFGLRGEESDGDEAFVHLLAKELNLPFYTARFETKEYARQKGISIQMAARDLRYQWFEEVRSREKYDLLATAHHLNDSVETVLLNLVHGTGLRGLTGIPEKTGCIVRPLLHRTRAELERYAQENQLSWRNDSSNLSTDYQRNYIRQQVVPLLEELNPNLLLTLDRMMSQLKDARELLDEKIAVAATGLIQSSATEHQLRLDLLPKTGLKLQLHELLRPFGFSYFTAGQIADSIPCGSGQRFYSPTHEALKDRQRLLIRPKQKSQQGSESEGPHFSGVLISESTPLIVTENYQLQLQKKSLADHRQLNDPTIAALDLSKLQYPLIVRKWQRGDRFVPLGMSGSKLVSDLLIDLKLSGYEKEQVNVLVSGGEIAWLIGYRISDRFKLTTTTEAVLEVTYLKFPSGSNSE